MDQDRGGANRTSEHLVLQRARLNRPLVPTEHFRSHQMMLLPRIWAIRMSSLSNGRLRVDLPPQGSHSVHSCDRQDFFVCEFSQIVLHWLAARVAPNSMREENLS